MARVYETIEGVTLPPGTALFAPEPSAPAAAADSAGDNGVSINAQGREFPREFSLRELTPKEEAFCREVVQRNNQALAYRSVYSKSNSVAVSWACASELCAKPHIRARLRELRSIAAKACTLDVSALLDHDRRIVEAAEHMNDLQQYVWENCRYCNGVGHAYQWVDENEFYAALAKWSDDVAAAADSKRKAPPAPSSDGGYGFRRTNDPNDMCPQCEGRGQQTALICDTRKLTGPAAVLYKGVKVTSNGIELLIHDIDKAKDRLHRAAGTFGDDAASVARGAAAGAAAGSAMATRKALEDVESMSPEQLQREYMRLADQR
jgi:phage terminase small subunit